MRAFRDGDEHAILRLHNAAFSGHAPRTMEHWRWEYRDNPRRQTEITVAMDGSDCVAVYSGVTHRAVLDGKPCLAGLHTDCALDARLRGSARGLAALVATMRLYFDLYAGGETAIAWGYPEPALHRIGLRYVDFEVLRDVHYLIRESTAPCPTPTDVQARVVSRFDDDVDALWERVAPEVGTGLIRDQRYLNWRYADHASIEHVLLEARDGSGRLRGVTALRRGGWDDQLLSMMDWVVPRDDRDAEAALIAAASRRAADQGCPYLAHWCAGAPILFHRFQRDHQFLVQPTPYQQCFRSWVSFVNRRWLHDHLYQTMGDIDFM